MRVNSPMVQIGPRYHVRLDQIIEVWALAPEDAPYRSGVRLPEGLTRRSPWRHTTVLRRMRDAGLAWVNEQVAAEWRVGVGITQASLPRPEPEPEPEEKPGPRFIGS